MRRALLPIKLERNELPHHEVARCPSTVRRTIERQKIRRLRAALAMVVSTLPVAVTGRGCAAVQISDADRRRKILLLLATDKCTLTLKKWRDKGESLRVDRCRCIAGRCLYQIMILKCVFVELGDSDSVSS